MLSGGKLYFVLVGAHLKSKLQYKASFIIEAIAQFLITFLDFAAIAVILSRFPTLGGWSLSEIAFLYGMSSISFSLALLFVRGFETFDRYVQMGELDRILTRPLSPFLQVLSVELAINRVGRLAQGLVVFFIGLAGLRVQWDAAKIGLLLATLIAGIVIFMAIFLIGAVTTIWTVSTAELTNIFTHGGTYLTSFPLTIYQEWFRNFFIFIIPLGFINYLPALLILDKGAPGGVPLWLGYLSLPAAAAFFGLALLFWGYGLRKYQSTGN